MEACDWLSNFVWNISYLGRPGLTCICEVTETALQQEDAAVILYITQYTPGCHLHYKLLSKLK